MNMDMISGGSLILTLAALFTAFLRASTPILFAALGGLISDLAGVVNVGLEGLMLLAAFFGVIGSAYAPLVLPADLAWAYPFFGAAAGLTAAVLAALLLALFHLEFGADLIVAGISINLLAAGLTMFLMSTLTGDKGSTAALTSYVLPTLHVPFLSVWPGLDAFVNGSEHEGYHILIYLAFACAGLLSFFLGRTRIGLHLRAVGENRVAALAAGLPAKRLQYLALAISGLLAGLGGLYLSMGYLTLFQADMTSGRGFLALAAVFLGARRSSGVFGAALLFGASAVLTTQLGLLHIPSQLVYMVPPLLTIIALLAFNQRRAFIRRRQIASQLRRMQQTLASQSKTAA